MAAAAAALRRPGRALAALALLLAAAPAAACDPGPVKVAFAPGSARLDAAGRAKLDMGLVDLWAKHGRGSNVRLYGGGGVRRSAALRARRIAAVKAYLLGRGLRAERIFVEAPAGRPPRGETVSVDLQ
jgi:hypothetical protein